MKKWLVILLIPIVIIFAVVMLDSGIPKQGYYYDGWDYWYNQNGQWFRYEDLSEWIAVDRIGEELQKNWKKWYLGLNDPGNDGVQDFTETSYYAEYYRNNVYHSE